MATDTFVDSNGTSLPDHNADWVEAVATGGAVSIQNNTASWPAFSQEGWQNEASEVGRSDVVLVDQGSGNNNACGPAIFMNSNYGICCYFVTNSGDDYTRCDVYRDTEFIQAITSLTVDKTVNPTLSIEYVSDNGSDEIVVAVYVDEGSGRTQIGSNVTVTGASAFFSGGAPFGYDGMQLRGGGSYSTALEVDQWSNGDAGGGTEQGQTTEAAESGATFSAVVNSPVSVSNSAQSSDQFTAIAQISAAIVEAVESGDTPTPSELITALLSNSANSNDLVTALAAAAGALVEGSASNASWVATAQAIVDVQDTAQISDLIQRFVEGLGSGVISEGSQSGETFLASVRVIADLTHAATTADALSATLTAICFLADQIQAGDAWVGTDQGIVSITKSITEAAQSSGLFVGTAQATAQISEAIQSSATFVAIGFGATGYLVKSAITIVAQLGASLSLDPKLSGTPSLEPPT